jgi:hypothetical protein
MNEAGFNIKQDLNLSDAPQNSAPLDTARPECSAKRPE